MGPLEDWLGCVDMYICVFTYVDMFLDTYSYASGQPPMDDDRTLKQNEIGAQL